MVNLNKKTGFIGAGNMAEAVIGAITRTGVIPSSMVYASDVNAERLNMLKKSYGISGVADNLKLFSICDIIILAVKPQQMADVLQHLTSQNEYSVPRRKMVISIAAGVPLDKLENLLYSQLNKAESENTAGFQVWIKALQPLSILQAFCAAHRTLADLLAAVKHLPSAGALQQELLCRILKKV